MGDHLERLLAKAFGDDVRITGAVDLGGDWAPVRRLSLDNGTTVVVKTRRERGGVWGSEAAVLDNERRGLELVNSLGVDVAPRLLAADAELGILVMSDVGTGPSVEDLLFGENAADATAGLVALARTAGALHAASAGAEHEQPWQERTTFPDRAFELWPEVREAAVAFGFPAPVEVSDDLAELQAAFHSPRFRVFVHGDLTPNNVVLTPGGARLVDFEGSGFRHFAVDAACLRLPFPQYGYWAALPPDAIAAMDAAYRAELTTVLDDEDYVTGIAAGCAAWAIIRAYRLPLIASTGQQPGLCVRRRTQIVQTLTSFAEIALRAGRFEALARWFLAVVEEMRDRWVEARQPPREYPAYGGSLVRES